MSKLPVVSARALIRVLERSGFSRRGGRGSHAVFVHVDGRRTTVPLHGRREIPQGTLHAILKDLKISKEQLTELLRNKEHVGIRGENGLGCFGTFKQ